MIGGYKPQNCPSRKRFSQWLPAPPFALAFAMGLRVFTSPSIGGRSKVASFFSASFATGARKENVTGYVTTLVCSKMVSEYKN